MKKIAYVGNFSFPNGNASGSRVLGNGHLLRELGYEVLYIGLHNSLSGSSKLEDTEQFHEGFRYYNLPYPTGVKGWISYKDRYNEVVSLLKDENLYAVISYGSPTLSLFGNLIRKWSKKNNLIYLTDCVDWLSSSSGTIIYRTIKFLDDNYQKRILNVKADGVITISSFLSHYYAEKGCKTVVIPPLVNIERYKQLDIEKSSKSIQFIYVGMPFATDGRSVKENSYKDRLDIVLEALSRLTEFDFVFSIYGITKDQYLSVLPRHKDVINQIGDKLQFKGKINNNDAIVKIAQSDYTLLFRDVNRMTSAGFPTKFVETISCGTPIITTDTSDLKEYVEIGKNGFFVSIDDRDLLHHQLKEIFSIERSKISEMKKYCMESELFSHLHYKAKMKFFMDSF